ncbi:hypothetical protein EGR_11316 [Echinococcus granulosus]|uniref:Uncharacterized protein n=1 Tax=Echinococcus granulosus TaxID=6210 RepID=W6TYN0_ECHGR|nr:hypothetical protein EGR_11316 [Echinococcus granulosus]EUB53833.1 hypothetical protein EGR_11316 [Echinococcus granulosus]
MIGIDWAPINASDCNTGEFRVKHSGELRCSKYKLSSSIQYIRLQSWVACATIYFLRLLSIWRINSSAVMTVACGEARAAPTVAAA